MTPFGSILAGKDVRDKVLDQVKLWAPTYLAEVGAQHGKGRADLPNFRSWTSKMTDPDAYVENQLPCCVAVAPGTIAGKGMRRPRSVDVQWAVGLAAIVSGQDEDNTYELAELYCAALRTLMLQHPSVGGIASGVTFLSERCVALDSNGTRTLAAGIVQLGVDVQGIVDPSQGPAEPSETPTEVPPEWPEVESVAVEVLAGVDGT